MEVSFGSLADWEAFLSRIPGKEHVAWSQVGGAPERQRRYAAAGAAATSQDDLGPSAVAAASRRRSCQPYPQSPTPPRHLHTRRLTQRAQRLVVDGSPRWEIYRALELPLDGARGAAVGVGASVRPAAAAPQAATPFSFFAQVGGLDGLRPHEGPELLLLLLLLALALLLAFPVPPPQGPGVVRPARLCCSPPPLLHGRRPRR
jgi:hypothetical protein